MSALEKQKALQKTIANAYVRFTKSGSKLMTQGAAMSRMENLKKDWEKFEKRHDELLDDDSVDAKDIYFTGDAYEACQESYLTNLGEFHDWLLKLDRERITQPQVGVQEALLDVEFNKFRLPQVNLEEFSGEVKDWIKFRDMFEEMIVKRTNLANIYKMHFLKQYVKGEAAEIIEEIPIGGENFPDAWKALKEHYDNRRLITNKLMSKLMSVKPMSGDIASELSRVQNNVKNLIKALKTLNVPTEHWDVFTVFHTISKLTPKCQAKWEDFVAQTENPQEVQSFASLNKFLDAQRMALTSLESSKGFAQKSEKNQTVNAVKSSNGNQSQNQNSKSSNGSSNQSDKANGSASKTKNTGCQICKGDHVVFKCETMVNKNPIERKSIVAKKRLCFNCLGSHAVADCKSTKRCGTCSGKHHSLIHTDQSDKQAKSNALNPDAKSFQSTASANPSTSQVAVNAAADKSLYDIANSGTVLLPTAWVQIHSNKGFSTIARAMIDQGAQSSFISEEMCQSLQLQRTPVNIPITGIGTRAVTCKSQVEFLIKPHFISHASFKVKAFVLGKLTAYNPQAGRNTEWAHLQGLKLADPNFGRPGRINLLLGAKIHAMIVEEGLVQPELPGAPIATKTKLGWVISGPTSASDRVATVTAHVQSSEEDLNQSLRRFWELEEPSNTVTHLTPEQMACEKFYENTTQRLDDGRYMVRLPLRSSLPTHWGNSYEIAVKRMKSLENRFERDGNLKKLYIQFMRDMIGKGYMRKVTIERSDLQRCCFLPHHAVMKESSNSTKLRVVFNASSKSSCGKSLNECLLNGPNLLPEISVLIFQWRLYKYVFVADVVKMYLQILLSLLDQHLQAVVWREDASKPLETYFLTTVTFGFVPSGYIASKTLRKAASDNGDKYPLAKGVVESETYMDNVTSGAHTIEEAKVKLEQTMQMFSSAGFDLRQWMANDPQLIQDLPADFAATKATLKVGQGFSVLGLVWDPQGDAFRFNVAIEKVKMPLTKRKILSVLAKAYDPSGWVAPIVIGAKIFMQSLHLQTREWDQPLSAELAAQWENHYNSLSNISKVNVPRWFQSDGDVIKYEFHGFADASKKACAAVLYLRVLGKQGSIVSLVGSKTRVAPLRTQSIPKLELCAAHLLATFVGGFVKKCSLTSVPIHLWSDSTDVLHWVHGVPAKWPTFVANRCADIENLVGNAQWHHINSKDNPADVASRGCNVEEINDNDLWWHGPQRLRNSGAAWPKSSFVNSAYNISSVDLRLDSSEVALAQAQNNPVIWPILDEYSSFTKLSRIVVYVLRFVRRTATNCIGKTSDPIKNFTPSDEVEITKSELLQACDVLCRVTQNYYYADIIEKIREGKCIARKHPVFTLNPILKGGHLRVGGRLKNALLSDDEKFPIILPAEAKLVELLIRYTHKITLHGGVQICLAHIRQRYWIVRARQQIKYYISKCVICKRFKAEVGQQQMAHLPAERVRPSRPFLKTGLDYAGPYSMLAARFRGQKSYKGWIAVFVCMATKAVHLEVVSAYDTQAFLAAFRRFIARRGICSSLFSDGAKNFEGADAELQALFAEDSEFVFKTKRDLANQFGVVWNFNPPAAPHFGGLWEAAVGSVKFHLKRAVGDTLMTFEEFSTLLAQIEAILNSRPLIPLADDPSDSFVLTPSHFLIGEQSLLLPENDICDEKLGPLEHWRRVTQVTQTFWKRWSSAYLQSLQRRQKWHLVQPSIKVGDIVLVLRENTPPTRWPLAKVIEVAAGSDDLVRVAELRVATEKMRQPGVKLQTATTTLTRPIVKLVKLLDGTNEN